VRTLPGTVLLAASCYPFLEGHIFHPTGVIAMLGIAAGCALLAAAAPVGTAPQPRPGPDRLSPPVART
jgi:hypothetical protein